MFDLSALHITSTKHSQSIRMNSQLMMAEGVQFLGVYPSLVLFLVTTSFEMT